MRKSTKFLLSIALMASFAHATDGECENKNALACFASAKSYDEKNESEKALEFYKKACELDYALGCAKTGEKYQNLKNHENAKKFYSKACDLNHHESCVNWGEIFENEGNCDKASEIYQDTFKNKKYKLAGDRFEALVGNTKCITEDFDISKTMEATDSKCQPNDGMKYYLEGVKYKNNQSVNDAVILQTFQKSCDCGEGKGCDEVANVYWENFKDLPQKRKDKTKEAMIKACEGDIVTGCEKVYLSYERGYLQADDRQEKMDNLKEKMVGLAARHERLCKANDKLENALHCDWVADFYFSTKRDHEIAEAARLYKRACDLGVSNSCWKLAEIYSEGHDSKTNPEDTIKFDFAKYKEFAFKACKDDVKRACKSLDIHYTLWLNENLCLNENNEKSCVEVGKIYDDGYENQNLRNYRYYIIKANRHKAQEFYKKGCNLNDYQGCYLYGYNLLVEEYYKAMNRENFNYNDAIELLLKACDNGYSRACDKLGSKGVELLDLLKSCDTNNATNCVKAGDIYYNGFQLGENIQYNHVIVSNKRKAVELVKKSCELNDPWGCNYLGYIYDKGEAIRQDDDLAVKFYKKSCELGHGQACLNLGYAYETGKLGVNKDIPKAHEYFGLACDYGKNQACEKYKETKN
ncbi:hypothetical protein OFO10_03400 [Campylobacter sp. VBCF_06 NA8]|uniref:tetratricopeptide repeat protein n=1 Tax=Campylobacter sp. VBCF_06 NA8 TaxID=2983822 RepID=UPI0022E9ED74|nr:hypothetical protein [Campylobacter sp. VBCF_06 NA8]MDA3046194.1 hypothetical protein [Campylobacter sp. VBCF_06 NA8]